MDSEDKVLAKVFGIQSLSSSAQSTPEKNGHSDAVPRGQELLQEYLKSGPKKELLRTCIDKEKKHSASSKYKTSEHVRTSNKGCKNQELRKTSSNHSTLTNHQAPTSRKQPRKGENPVRLPPTTELSPEFGCSSSWVCKNSACRAVLTSEDTFCKRCSCCICHLFDDNKDPSLWLVCTSESGGRDSCGSSCHIECALQRQKVGVVNLGPMMRLDGSYCCASCGKVSGILGYWKKQLVIAKDARRVDVLCHRISLSYRLLDGTSRFEELHEIVEEAKAKLETEVGSISGVSAKMGRGIVSRLSIAGDVQKLCSIAIEKADAHLSAISSANPHLREDSLPAACRLQFQEVTSESLVIVLKEPCSTSSNNIKGYKLWYCKSRGESYTKEPIIVLPRAQMKVSISDLQPCTEYTFRIISYTESGDLGHSEAKCFTKSVEVIHKNSTPAVAMDHKNENSHVEGSSSSAKEEPRVTTTGGSSGFKVRDLGKVLHLAWAQEHGCFDGFCSADVEECCGRDIVIKREDMEEDRPRNVTRELDLNVVSVPDLNAEVTPPLESSRDEDIGCTSERVVEAEDDVVSHGMEKIDISRSNGSGDSQTWTVRPIREVPAVESRTELCRKRASSADEETFDCDSILINGSSFPLFSGASQFDETFEYCVKIIRWLECSGHIEHEFRMKFLTWFSLRSTHQERRVVYTFIQTLIDDPSSLAGQLIDSFLDIISSKRPRNGFCSKLWH
ncbi:VIN3-like protein 1 isoform X2 [Macadamia integrifolia]|nr:VIN3-like protein 1 isoform X2 [Macadamia integrifolia]XP_042490642.1 VIN3-like protein 1 isoform X2 [Macadamia integrifolia]XP_042490643.1 VIN3-like protein 1 isoform X2 [Macadamia integrifolia]